MAHRNARNNRRATSQPASQPVHLAPVGCGKAVTQEPGACACICAHCDRSLIGCGCWCGACTQHVHTGCQCPQPQLIKEHL